MPFLQNLRRMMIIYHSRWKWIALSQVFILFSAIFTLLIPFELANLINSGIGTNNSDIVINSSLSMMLYAVIAAAFVMANLFFATKISEGTGNYIRTQVYRKIQHFSFKNLDAYPVGDLLVRLTNDVYQINMAVQLSVRFLFFAPFMIIIAVILVALYSPSLLWIILLAIPASIIVFGGTGYVLQKQYPLRQKMLDRVNTILQEALSGIRVVKAFVRQDYEVAKFDEANNNLYKSSVKPQSTIAFIIPGVFLILGLANAAAIWFGGNEILSGTGTDVGELMAFSQYFFMILIQMFILSLVFPQIMAAEASAARLAEIFDAVPDVPDAPQAFAVDPSSVKGRVVFENVSFSYEGPGGHPAISDISFIAEPGETVAFLGPTGSGKSTIINLIPRFYDVTEGKITIDGADIKEMTQESLRQVVVPALQVSILFSGNIRDNICYGKPGATQDEITEAARAADAHDFITAIPGGYDAKVARKGANFSGGQRQRLSIARAIVPSPRVIILDDSTSAVDVATEARIQAAMSEILKGATCFVVAQRISTVLNADKIVLLDNGRIVATGSHSEMLESSPLYREIFDSQLGGIAKGDVL